MSYVVRSDLSAWVMTKGANLRVPADKARNFSDSDLLERVSASGFTAPPSKSSAYVATVALTMACNLRCPYCFQYVQDEGDGGLRGPNGRAMTTATARSTANFITAKARHSGMSSVALTLFGGEPTLAPESAVELLDGVRREVPVDASIVTNGYLLRPKLLYPLAERGVGHVQVSFDGNRQMHDITRKTVTGKGTYDQILDNVRACADQCPDITWSFRVNVTSGGHYRLQELIDDLATLNLTARTVVYFARIHATQNSGLSGHDDNDVTNLIKDAYRAAWNAGFHTPEPVYPEKCPTCGTRGGRTGCCVGPDGTLFSCLESIGEPGMGVGTVVRGYDEELVLSERWVSCASESTDIQRSAGTDPLDAFLLDHHYGVVSAFE